MTRDRLKKNLRSERERLRRARLRGGPDAPHVGNIIWLQEGASRLSSLFDGNQALSAPYLKVAQIKQRLPQLLAQEPWVGHSHVWRLVNLEVWLRRFMGGQTGWKFEQSM